jgi:hypothetical protein
MDELERIQQMRDEARTMILDLLRAPWSRMTPWAISNACAYMEHPDKYDGHPEKGCPCGRRRDATKVKA